MNATTSSRALALRLWFFSRTDRVATDPGWSKIPACATDSLAPELLDKAILAHLDAEAEPVVLPYRTKDANGKLDPARRRLGSYTPTPSGLTSWACIDFDGAGGGKKRPMKDPLGAAQKVLDACESATVPAFLERSKSGKGYHVWMFFKPALDARLARAFCLRICPTDEQLEDGSPAIARKNLGMEVFPKQVTLDPKGAELGNMVWLPWWHGAQAGNNVFLRRLQDGQLEEYEPQFEPAPEDVITVLGQEQLEREAAEGAEALAKRKRRGQAVGTGIGAETFAAACSKYRDAHPMEYPRKGSKCEVCGSASGFKASGIPGRWVCFSASHEATRVGFGPDFRQGDVVHLDAHKAGLEPREFLIREGYLVKGSLRSVKPGAGGSGGDGGGAPPPSVFQGEPGAEGPQGAPAPVIALHDGEDLAARPLKSRSALSLKRILTADAFKARVPFLRNKAIELDEMTGEVCIGRVPLKDVDLVHLQTDIEAAFPDHQGGGLEYPTLQIEKALAQVASTRPFHPIREYLDGLVWDGTKRLDVLAQKTLGIENPTKLVVSQIRKTLISAVARAYEPGCYVKAMLVLVGPQDAGKSAWFRALVPEARFFADKSLNIDSKESELLLARVWICEWAEMTAVEGKSAEKVKAFISSRSSHIILKFSNKTTEVLRSSIFVGSANPSAILTDPTGGRRFWPVMNGPNINHRLVEEKRDQLWAEAVAAYKAKEQWWLTPEESLELDKAQEPFQADTELDAGVGEAARVFGERPFSMSALVERMSMVDGRVRKSILDVTKATTDRVSTSLKRLGYTNEHRFRVDGHRVRLWALKTLTFEELRERLEKVQPPHFSEPDDSYDVM